MENKYNGFEIKSDAQYKDISSISFTPIHEIKTTRKYKKGDWRFWKWLGLIPLIPYKVTRDLHESNSWDGLKSLERVRDNSYHRFIHNGRLYDKAEVYVRRIVGNNSYERFTSNEAAIKYIDNLKERCKEVGNELK